MADQTQRNALEGGAALVTSVAGLALGWIGYSALRVNHHVPLSPAIDAERRAFVDRHGRLLTYYADTSGTGHPLVLVHSINAAGSAFEMRPLFDFYRGKRPVYALDLPGFGFSDRADRDYSPEVFAHAILDLLHEIDGPADVVALSLSSEFAARAALDAPDKISSLAFISPTGLQADPREDPGNDRALAMLSFPLWSQAIYDALVTRAGIRYYLKKSFAGPVDEGMVDYAYTTTHQPGARYAPLSFVTGMLFTPDAVSTLYERLTVPVLVLYDEDAFTSFERLPDLLERCPNWNAQRITPTRGLPQFEQIADVTHVLDHFWTAQFPL
ncbi:MAG TPA: alpha/beta fold hydrolase [Aggregatilinea sp.]|uniref:alpha/beta fold hydrolase n=1 Tax=Aggregatilinea sp. TaxID=2806333 RepID=UPI002C357FEA|nr:alpha/beta fold hydrolase [Aggregatilinea sp.]HML21032.1 alpha/beta fold hydrolase [Aggregatilinea sp.]